ncbi:hypothetical protein EJ04DRAFT_566742 [Polyplosphaeria fusca]|uniref:Uncharacterized protein n=1 Tax=Polyplosphaeria fusca TaxID=682080 RepID=A0A9P4V015_9PLEO|nr:hypothetical protein EJ04DRAFT_566742 [Polyplosphaeria fusca]
MAPSVPSPAENPHHELQQRVQNANRERQAIMHEIQEQQRRLEALNGAYKVATQNLELEAIACAKAECLSLAASVHSKLPQELRDAVYGYLLYECGLIEHWFHLNLRKSRSGVTLDISTMVGRYTVREYCYFLFPDFVGLDFAREVVATLYGQKPNTIVQVPELRQYLAMDVFNVGLLPGDYLRCLTIDLCVDYVAIKEERDCIVGAMESLRTIRLKNGFYLTINIDNVYFELNDKFPLRACLELMRDTCQVMRAAGASVKLVICDRRGKQQDVANFYELNTEDWQRWWSSTCIFPKGPDFDLED